MASSRQRRNDKAITIVAENLWRYSKMRNLTIQELAFKIDVDYSQISRMERNKVNFTITMLIDVAQALDILPQELLSGI